MSTFVAVTILNDEEPDIQFVEFTDQEAAEAFVLKVDGLHEPRSGQTVEAEVVKPTSLNPNTVDLWIGDNLDGFSKSSFKGSGAQRA